MEEVAIISTLKLLKKSFCVLFLPSWDKKASLKIENDALMVCNEVCTLV